MKKGGIGGLGILVIFTFLFLIANTSANIFLEQPLSLYNLGQKLSMNTKLLSQEDFSGYVDLNLICSDQDKETKQVIYFSPVTLEKNKEKQFTVSFQVMKKGRCFFESNLEDIRHKNEETEKTSEFTVSNLINLELEFNKLFFMPEDEIEIKGTAVKANGEAVNGFATISIETPSIIFINETSNETNNNQNQTNNQTQQNQTFTSSGNTTNLTFSFSVIDGEYFYKFNFPKDISPGEKEVTIKIEDGYGNEGYDSGTITIAAVPTQLIIEISGSTTENPESFMPGTIIILKASLLDQASQVMEKNLSLKIEKGNKILLEQFTSSNKFTEYKFEKNQTPGDYKIKAYGEGLNEEKLIYISELKEINIELENDSLHIINIGNVPYKESIEITFTKEGVDETKIVDLNLKVGEEIFIRLEAPMGEYDVSVSSPSQNLYQTLTFEGVPLTGDVITTVELEKEGTSWPGLLIFILIAVIVVLAILFLVSEKKKRKLSPRKIKGIKPIKKIKLEEKIKEMKQEKEKEKWKKGNKEEIKEIKKQEDKKKGNKMAIRTKFGTLSLSLRSKHKEESHKTKLLKEKQILAEPQDDFSRTVKKIFLQHSQKTGVSTILPKLIFGDKRTITALFLRIDGLKSLKRLYEKNPMAFEKILNNYFSVVVDKIRTNQGIAEIYDNTIFIMFNAIKQYSHDMSAIKTAEDIRTETHKFNERYKPLAKFYVASGINTGNAILSTIGEDKILKYLSLNNTTNIAKELEKKANSNDILLSQNTYERIKNSIEAKKTSPLFFNKKQSIDTYSLEQLSLRSKYKDRISKIVRDFKNPYF